MFLFFKFSFNKKIFDAHKYFLFILFFFRAKPCTTLIHLLLILNYQTNCSRLIQDFDSIYLFLLLIISFAFPFQPFLNAANLTHFSLLHFIDLIFRFKFSG